MLEWPKYDIELFNLNSILFSFGIEQSSKMIVEERQFCRVGPKSWSETGVGS